jgi:hypothetical protein
MQSHSVNQTQNLGGIPSRLDSEGLERVTTQWYLQDLNR